jgi:hypothetical protein
MTLPVALVANTKLNGEYQSRNGKYQSRNGQIMESRACNGVKGVTNGRLLESLNMYE